MEKRMKKTKGNSRILKKISILLLSVFISACASKNIDIPSVIPADKPIIQKSPVTEEKKYDLGVIGAIEPVYILPQKIALLARIDTGAKTSSLDAKNVKLFERDGVQWVAFDVVDRKTKMAYHFEKKLRRKISIKRIEKDEDRYVVNMDILFGKKTITEEFTLADREKFEYPVLIGRNILTGRAVVDTSISNTFY